MTTVAMLSLGGCTISQKDAEDAIRRSDFISERATAHLVLYRNLVMDAENLRTEHPEALRFVIEGLVQILPVQPLGAKFVLTEQGERARSTDHWQSAPGPSGQEGWMVPTARKVFISVGKPSGDSNRADCTFHWKWSDAHGSPGDDGRETQTSTAHFEKRDSRWEMESIR